MTIVTILLPFGWVQHFVSPISLSLSFSLHLSYFFLLLFFCSFHRLHSQLSSFVNLPTTYNTKRVVHIKTTRTSTNTDLKNKKKKCKKVLLYSPSSETIEVKKKIKMEEYPYSNPITINWKENRVGDFFLQHSHLICFFYYYLLLGCIYSLLLVSLYSDPKDFFSFYYLHFISIGDSGWQAFMFIFRSSFINTLHRTTKSNYLQIWFWFSWEPRGIFQPN